MESDNHEHSGDRTAHFWSKFVELNLFVVYALNLGFPKYLNDVLHIPVEKNSIYTSLPRMTNIFVSIFAGFMSDWLHTKCKMRLTTVRKTFCVLGMIQNQLN